jgi:signal transduction histidine kinase
MPSAKGAQATPVEGRDALDSKFLSTTIHNLREPTRIFNMYAKMLADGVSPDPEIFCHMQAGAEQLQYLLDGLSDFAFAISEPPASSARIPLDGTLLQALGHLRKEGFPDVTVAYKDLPVVNAPFDHLTLIFRHLLRNSIQNSPDAPKISVRATPDDECWIVEVRDKGSGIEPQYHQKIFAPYFRLHRRERPSNGLGLAICKAIIQGFGGRIWVESEPGNGAAFFFTLPR